MVQQHLPQGAATDYAFCNREKERKEIKHCIESHERLALTAPRRYGKTSLRTQVLKENNFPGINLDFFFVLTPEEVTKSIADGIAQVIIDILPKSKTAYTKIIDAVTARNPKLTFNFLGQKLEIGTKQNTEKSITELLLALDEIAVKSKKTCVLVFDECQQIGELKENHSVEAAIRHAVERSQNVSYIFCGSKRHLLREMFSNNSRPLYHLCDLMTIDRIKSESYQKFICKIAQSKWKIKPDNDAINEIIHLTENHPYYINSLCRRLWRNEQTPGIGDVRKTWNHYIKQQSNWIVDDIDHLTLSRRKLFVALAQKANNHPQGQAFASKAGLATSTIKKCLMDLEKMDMIYKDSDGFYRVLDPAVAYFIREYS